MRRSRFQALRQRGYRRRQVIRHRLVDRHPFCFYCARPMTRTDSTLDHVIPLCDGGLDDEPNFVVACRRCNRRKANHDFEFLACGLAPGWGFFLIKQVQEMNERFALNPNWKRSGIRRQGSGDRSPNPNA